jgi:hypothetical protein
MYVFPLCLSVHLTCLLRVHHKQTFSSHGKAFAQALRLKPGSRIYGYAILLVAFFISGLYHAVPEYRATSNWSTSVAVCQFFMMQVIGIMTEDAVIAAGKYLGLRRNVVVKVIGMVWFWLWMTWSGEDFVNSRIQTGEFQRHAPQRSVVRWILGFIPDA